MFIKLIMHLFLNNINIINKCMHKFDISIETTQPLPPPSLL